LLITAASFNQEELVDLLLAQEGIEVNARGGYYGHTALHIACGKGSIACVNKLLAFPGIDVNALDQDKKTPIMWAVDQWPVASGSTEALRLLAAVGQVNLDCKFADWQSSQMGFADGQSLEERAAPPYKSNGPLPETLAILTEARERRKRLVMEQKAKVSKVLLEGLYEDPADPNCLLSMVRGPRELVMKTIWEYCTSDWQVYTESTEAPADGMGKLSI